ncbi:translocation/assembly module TamB domain-containing protein [Phormidium tenue FACHB-886]|nr:translocation/assembly module TamB domain-containing protein [Phormidium tenue FACHB-886]
MTNPNSENQPENQPEPRRRRRRWLWAGSAVGGVLLVGAAVGGWWTWRFVQNDLAPLVSRQVSDLFNRPVNIGELEQVSLTGLRFGASAMPKTATDADEIQVEAIEVDFNPLEVLWDRTLSLEVTLVNPVAYIDQDAEGQWITTQIKEQDQQDELIKIEMDTLRSRNGTLRLAPYGNVEDSEVVAEEGEPTPPSPTSPTGGRRIQPIIVMQEVNGSATFREDNKLIGYEVVAKPETGGSFGVSGTTDQRIQDQTRTTLNVQGSDLLAADVNLVVPLPLQLRAGLLDADLKVELPPNNEPLAFNGSVQLQNVTATNENVPKPITNLYGSLRFQGQQIGFQGLRGRYGELNAQAGGSLNTQTGYDLTVRVLPASVEDLLATAEVDPATLPIDLSGSFRAQARVRGSNDRPVVTGIIENTQAVQVDRVAFSSARSQFTATNQAVQFSNFRAVPAQGGLLSGRGEVTFGDRSGLVFDVRAQGLSGDAIARTYGANLDNFTVGTVSADAQVFGNFDNVQTLVRWQAPQATYPGRGTVAIADGNIRFRDTLLLVAGGLVRGQGEVSQNRWQATVNTSGIRLNQFNPDLRGLLSGNFNLGGSLDNFSLAAIQAQGQVRLSEGISLITQPLNASVRWLGDRLQIQQATAPGFDANGFVFAQLEGTPAITNLDLNVNLRGYNIAELPIPIPQQVQLAGTTDFSGRVSGVPEAPVVAGRLGVNGLTVNQTAFEPRLNGDFRYVTNRSLNLDVSGTQDRVALQLDSRNRPVSFYVQQGEAIARGRGNGDRLTAELQNFPIAILNLQPAAAYGLGQVTGRVNGNFNLNIADLANPDVVGEVAIANPALGYIKADSFTGRFRYIDGIGVLEQGELRQRNSRYLLSGSYSPSADQQFQGKITAEQGRVEDILTALQVFELSDFGRGLGAPTFGTAIDVVPAPVSTTNLSLLNQLRRYSEIIALRNQAIAQREQSTFLPDLSELQGPFTGDINLGYSSQSGVAVGFDLNGQDWIWGDYEVDQVVASGNFENGVLTLLPIRLESDQSLLTFSGQLGGENQSGQLRAANIPVEALRDLFNLPIDIQSGVLNANATLSGGVGNPQVLGELTLVDATINNQNAPPIRSLFGYSNARLDFDGRVIGDEVNTFQLNGSIPYAFPFMSVAPDSNELSLDVNIRNNGIALVSLFTDQVGWQGGEGEVNLQVRGTLDPELQSPLQLNASGNARFTNAIFSAQALPENITNVNGEILFNNDRIQVQSVQGQFSNGQVLAQGVLPILTPLFENDPDAATPLTVSLDNIAIELENRYEGDVNGTVLLTGSALTPLVGGEIRLSNGRVIIPNQEESVPVATASAPATPGFVNPPRFDNLRIRLGKNVRITNDPILDFVADGDLLVNETLDDLSLSGTVFLRRGQVNLFATQFNLVRDYDNRAEFSPTRGLDPFVDVRLLTSVPEVVRAPVANTSSQFGVAELADTTASPSTEFGAIQTIRVQASVTGPASQISNNLELTSSPSRTETEIVALIGGNFINGIGQATDNPTLALASVAGSTLLTQLQNLISDATGLTDFRLFTTPISSDNARSSTLGLAAELGADVTNTLSVSVLQILTADEPTRFSVRYRINEELLLRGSTNLEGESRAVLEFETRF